MRLKNNSKVKASFRLPSIPKTFELLPGQITKELEVSEKDRKVAKQLRVLGICIVDTKPAQVESVVSTEPETPVVSTEPETPVVSTEPETPVEVQVEIKEEDIKALVDAHTHPVLMEMAKSLNIEVPEGSAKKDIAKLILEAKAAQ